MYNRQNLITIYIHKNGAQVIKSQFSVILLLSGNIMNIETSLLIKLLIEINRKKHFIVLFVIFYRSTFFYLAFVL